jgi:hypothetical protein
MRVLISIILISASVLVGVFIERKHNLPNGLIGGTIGGLISIILVTIINKLYDDIFYRSKLYIPSIEISASMDGENFNTSIYSIPISENIYLKISVLIVAKGLYWKIVNNIIPFYIEYPESFTILDKSLSHNIQYQCKINSYTGIINQSEMKNYPLFQRYTVSVKNDENKKSKYTVFISDKFRQVLPFFMAASSKPKKAEVIFKIVKYEKDDKSDNPVDFCHFKINFDKRVHDVYSKTFELGFVDHFGNIL